MIFVMKGILWANALGVIATRVVDDADKGNLRLLPFR